MKKTGSILKFSDLETPLGLMRAISDEEFLYSLEFVDQSEFERNIYFSKIKFELISSRSKPLESIEKELAQYFAGKLKTFKTPIRYFGSPFQQKTWEGLRKIPYGKTCSYADLAKAIHQPTAFRACANANGANKLAIIVPCHRVINSNGELGGYSAGLSRKVWLLQHERRTL